MSIGFNDNAEGFHRWTGAEGLPGSNIAGGLPSLLLGNLLGSMMGNFGMTPMGLSDQNLYDRMRSRAFTQAHDEALRRLFKEDANSYVGIARGLTMAHGYQWGPEQEQTFRAGLNGPMAQFAPMMYSLAPGYMSMMGGMRGSAAGLAHNLIIAGGRGIDPYTGRPGGWEASTVEGLARDVFQQQFAGDNWQRLRGLPADQAGQLFGSLRRMGMTPALGQFAKEDYAEALNRDPKLTARGFDAQRVGRTFEQWKDAVNVMREIFAGQGVHGAKIGELMEALNQMTQGHLHELTPQKAAELARRMGSAVERSAAGLQGLLQLGHAGEAAAARMGVGAEGQTAAMVSAGRFEEAYRNLGLGQYRMPGQLGNVNRLMRLEQGQVLGAGGSVMANQIGAMRRMAERGLFAEGSAAANYLQNLEAGTLNQGMVMNDQAMAAMIVRSSGGKITMAEAYQFLGQRDQNVPLAGDRTQAIRELQGGELAKQQTKFLTNNMASFLRGRGVDPKQAAALGGQMAAIVQSVYANASPADLASGAVYRTIGSRLQELTAASGNARIQGIDAGQLAMGAQLGLGELDKFYRSTGQMTLAERTMLNNRRVRGAMQESEQIGMAENQIRSNLAGASPEAIRRFFQAMGDHPGATLTELLSVGAGGESKEELLKAIKKINPDIMKRFGEPEKLVNPKAGGAGGDEPNAKPEGTGGKVTQRFTIGYLQVKEDLSAELVMENTGGEFGDA